MKCRCGHVCDARSAFIGYQSDGLGAHLPLFNCGACSTTISGQVVYCDAETVLREAADTFAAEARGVADDDDEVQRLSDISEEIELRAEAVRRTEAA